MNSLALIFLSTLLQVTIFVCKTNATPWPALKICGTVNPKLFYNTKHATALNEYPWIGKIGFVDNSDADDDVIYKCTAVLISKRYVLTAALCSDKRHVFDGVKHVTFGGCSSKSKCSMDAQTYDVEDIAVHPDFSNKTLTNNLSLMRLAREVLFTDYIRPICFPARDVKEDYIIGQFLPYVGLPFETAQSSLKLKYLAHIMSRTQCEKLLENDTEIEITGNHLCGISDGDRYLMCGAALMGVIVAEAEARYFYLIGILIHASSGQYTESMTDRSEVFLRIDRYRNWIYDNVVE